MSIHGDKLLPWQCVGDGTAANILPIPSRTIKACRSSPSVLLGRVCGHTRVSTISPLPMSTSEEVSALLTGAARTNSKPSAIAGNYTSQPQLTHMSQHSSPYFKQNRLNASLSLGSVRNVD
jgi:hypothetical protein